jgi:hypothetical protein
MACLWVLHAPRPAKASGDAAPGGVRETHRLAVLPIINTRVLVKMQVRHQSGTVEEKTESQDAFSLGLTTFDRDNLDLMIMEQVQRIPIYRLVDRSDIQSVLDERTLQATQEFSAASTAEKGRLIGAEYILQPFLIALDDIVEGDPKTDGFYSNVVTATVGAKLISVDTGEVEWVGSGRGRTRAAKSANRLAATEDAFRSCLAKLVEHVNETQGLNLPVKTSHRPKSPGAAVALSIVPGLGQYYADNPEAAKETALMAVVGGGAAFLVDHEKEWVRIASWAVIGVAGGTYLGSFLSAYKSARKYNVEMGLTSEAAGAIEPAAVRAWMCVTRRF